MNRFHGGKSMARIWSGLLAAVALFLGSAGGGWAATVGFDPSVKNVALHDSFTVDIVGSEFTELAGGTINLGFSSAFLRIDSVDINTTLFDFEPDGGGPANGDTWPGIAFDTFANSPAVGDFTIATVHLTALALTTAGDQPVLSILASSQFFSSTEELFPTLGAPGDGTVNVVPVPAAVWLFGSGLLGVAGVARRRT